MSKREPVTKWGNGKYVVAQRAYKIGLQTLWYDRVRNHYYVSLQNKSYASIVPISSKKAVVWQRILEGWA